MKIDPRVLTMSDPIAVNASQLAAMLGVSVRHIRRMDSAGQLPQAIRLGRSKRWPVETIREWLSAGAPARAEWEAIGKASGKEGRHAG